jgi:hypothetical protein
MVFEDILGECARKIDEVSMCPRCGSTDIGTRSVAGKTIGFFLRRVQIRMVCYESF